MIFIYNFIGFSILYVAHCTAWKPPTNVDSARLSLAVLCRSRPAQLPTADMKALGGFFKSFT